MAEDENTTVQEEQSATVVDELKDKFGGAVQAESAFRGDLTVRVAPGDIVRVMTFLKNVRRPVFNMLTDVCGADYPEREKRFDVVYHLVAMDSIERLRVKTSVSEGEEVPTLTGLWKSSNWQEREVYDMFGVRFSGHPNMTRILMWEGYDGWPLRKDFPLKGNKTSEERYHEKDIRRTRQYKQYCWEGYCTDL